MPDFNLLLYSVDQFSSLDTETGTLVTGASLSPIAITVTDDDSSIEDSGDPGLSDLTPDLITASSDPSFLGEAVRVDNGPGQTIQNSYFGSGRDIDGDGDIDFGFVVRVTIAGQDYIVTSESNPLLANTDYSTPTTIFIEGASWNNLGFSVVTCFAAGTYITTNRGKIRVEDLMQGEMVLTMDHGYKPIEWIGCAKFDSIDLTMNPKLKPIRIRAGALGAECPQEDLLVSPQHRVLVRSKIAQRMFGTDEILIPAVQLTALEGVDIQEDVTSVAYYHVLFNAHEIVFSNGAPTESLFLGAEALKSLSPQSRREIETLFPELKTSEFEAVSVRRIPEKGKRMKKLVERHQINQRALFMN